jgi:hypothetical protein
MSKVRLGLGEIEGREERHREAKKQRDIETKLTI